MPNKNQITDIIELGVQQVGGDFRNQQLAIAALAQENARKRVAAANITNMVDNSGGTASAVGLVPIPPLVVVPQDGVTPLVMQSAAGPNMGFTMIGLMELAVKTNAFIDAIAPGSPPINYRTANPPPNNGAIPPIPPSVSSTVAPDEGMLAKEFVPVINGYINFASILASAINWVRVAQGLAPISDMSGGTFTKLQHEWGQDWYVSGATKITASAGEDAITAASFISTFLALRDNLATLAAALTQANAPAIGPFVVATNNARTRLSAGDVTP